MNSKIVTFIILLFMTQQISAASSGKITARLNVKLQASRSNIHSVWIYFTDKDSKYGLLKQSAEQNLLPHALKRRIRNRGVHNITDKHDYPVSSRYILQVSAYTEKIRQKSRWLNAVSAEVHSSNLSRITDLPFVQKIDLLMTTRRLPEVAEETVFSNSFSRLSSATHNLDYGASIRQNSTINVPALHDSSYSGSGIIIGMLDTGFNNLQHEVFQFTNILATRDFVNGDSSVADDPGQMGNGSHGTKTFSILGGYAPGNLIGTAYGASYLLAKTENTDYEHNIEEDHWIAGAEWADSLGADIITSSLGYSDFDLGQISYGWEEMDGNSTVVTRGADLAASRGMLVVNSAGNDGNNPEHNTLGAPADGDSVLAVGSINAEFVRSSFSSVGPTADGRIKPDVMAMGSGVRYARSDNTSGYNNVGAGTSFSCPLTAGAAALLMQAVPTATNMEIIDALRSTASQSHNPDNLYGYGVVNAEAALTYLRALKGNPGVAGQFNLLPNYPNPFNPKTTIEFYLPEAAEASLKVYNILGQPVATLFSGRTTSKTIHWQPRNLPSGVYFYTLKTAAFEKTRKMVYLR